MINERGGAQLGGQKARIEINAGTAAEKQIPAGTSSSLDRANTHLTPTADTQVQKERILSEGKLEREYEDTARPKSNFNGVVYLKH